jgi:hypothetical protein
MVPYLWLKRKMFEDPTDLSTVVEGNLKPGSSWRERKGSSAF